MGEVAPPVERAVVLAAGTGSRLNHGTPKPLFPVLGVPLLARTLFTLEEAGIRDAWIVLGHQGERVRAGIEAMGGRFRIRPHWLHNGRWEAPNGVSVLAAEGKIEGPFVLTMADHVFEAEAVTRLRAGAGEHRGLDLVVDRRPSRTVDMRDATRVRLQGDRIVDIGKGLADFDVVDTGIFLASEPLFEALRACDVPEGPSLSDGVRRLAREGRARAVDGTGLAWQDVDTRRDVKSAERALMARWPKATDGPVARHLNRPLSKLLSRRLAGTSVTPNQVSVGTLLVSLAAAALAAVGGYGPWLLAGILFQIASILDGVDGELAVLTHQRSTRGEWVDTVCDNLSYVACLAGLTFGAYRTGLPSFYVWGGIVGMIASAMSLGNIHVYLLRRGRSGSARAVEYGYQRRQDALSQFLRSLHYLGKRDLFSFAIMALAVAGSLPLALPLFGAGSTLLLLPVTTKANLTLVGRGDGYLSEGGTGG